MKLWFRAVAAFLLLATRGTSPSFGQLPRDEPTKQEVADAYRSKAGEGGTFIPHTRWERWRITEIRGWSLHFKRVSERRNVGILTRQYRLAAKKNGSCAEYLITDTVPIPPVNVQIKPRLVVEPSGVGACGHGVGLK